MDRRAALLASNITNCMLAVEAFHHLPLCLSSSNTVHNLNINTLPFQGSGTRTCSIAETRTRNEIRKA